MKFRAGIIKPARFSLTLLKNSGIIKLSINDKCLSFALRGYDMKMDKEKAVKKINKAGKVGYVTAIILQVLTVALFALSVFGSFSVGVVPKDFYSYETSVVVKGTLDYSKLDSDLDPDAIEESLDALKNNSLYFMMAGDDYRINDYEIDGDTVTFTSIGETATVTIKNLVAVFVFLAILCIFTFCTFFCAGLLCKAFAKCVSPFDEIVIKRMRLFAISLLPWSLFSMLGNLMLTFMSGASKVTLSINLAVIFTVLVIFALAYIFKYGAVLQKESDETL